MNMSPVQPSSLAPAPKGHRPSIDEETGRITMDDPTYASRRTLLREVFGVEFDEEAEEKLREATSGNNAAPVVQQPDTVTLSSQSIELQARQSASVEIRDSNGTLRISIESQQGLKIESQQSLQSADPLILDLDQDGIELTDIRTEEGVLFDLTGDGVAERVSWVRPDDGLLAYDRSGNGTIDNGLELFGDQHGAVDGFADLRKLDSDQNGTIDSNDALFSKLWVWQDRNGNGISESDELDTLNERGITSLSLQSTHTSSTIAGNRISAYSHFAGSSGSGLLAEAHLNYIA